MLPAIYKTTLHFIFVPMGWEPQPQQKHGFTALPRVRVTLRIRVEETTKPSAPALQLQKACQGQPLHCPSTAPFTPCSMAPQPRKMLIFLLSLGLGLNKPQSLELHRHCYYQSLFSLKNSKCPLIWIAFLLSAPFFFCLITAQVLHETIQVPQDH